MTDANNIYDINMRELDDVVLPDADETTEQHKSFSFHEGEVSMVSCWGQNTEIRCQC